MLFNHLRVTRTNLLQKEKILQDSNRQPEESDCEGKLMDVMPISHEADSHPSAADESKN
jgi:hypothetical protein